MSPPTVEILYFAGCPSYAAAAPAIRDIAQREGADVALIRIDSAEQAQRQRFLGSPTIRVDGVDVDPTAAGRDDYGMKCRLYVTPEGRRPVPPNTWIRTALRRARERRDGA